MYGDKEFGNVDKLHAEWFSQKFELRKTIDLYMTSLCEKSTFTLGMCKLCTEYLHRIEAVDNAFKFT